ncbi:MAG: type II toxin-antitoxin system RelE/ParE family toxin [Patescibacteria group bacterium]
MEHLEKLLRRVQPKHRAQILTVLACLQDEDCRLRLQPEKLSDVGALFRIHVGRYRIIFTQKASRVELVDVRLRNERTYRGLK